MFLTSPYIDQAITRFENWTILFESITEICYNNYP
jgi:hypothetical protein